MSLGTVKPMVDDLDLIAWVMDSASEVDAEIILHLSANARSDLSSLPSNVRLVVFFTVVKLTDLNERTALGFAVQVAVTQ